MSFLEVRDLCLDVGDFELSDIELKAEKGDYLALIGPSGSGKSLLLETVIGFYGPEKGRIILEGKDITDLPSRYEADQHSVPGPHAFSPHERV